MQGSRDLDIYTVLVVTGGGGLLSGEPGLSAMYQQDSFPWFRQQQPLDAGIGYRQMSVSGAWHDISVV